MQGLEESTEPVAFKVDDGTRSVLAAPVAPADETDGVAFRVDIRSLAGMQKEALVSRVAPAGSTWRLACDEGPYLNGSDLAPFPLGFFAAGLQFSFLTDLVRHARREGIRLDALSAVQDTRYTMAGSAIRGDMTGGALPVERQILVESGAAPDRIAALVALTATTCPADAVMHDVLANAFALTALTIKLIADALPPGVVNLVTGPASDVGEELLTHPLVRKINFTGGTDTGKHVMRTAAATLKDITLELGGNDPALILDDAEIDDAALERLVFGSFLTSGQICMAVKRIYVHRSLFGRVVEGFTGIAARHVVGSGLDPDVTMGPLNNADQLSVVQGLVADARARGATVHEVGRLSAAADPRHGYFHLPTVVTDIDPGAPVVSQEQFGPVMPIIAFDDESEAIRMANDTEFGLCSSVWSQDRDHALRVAKRLEAGYTYLNAHGPTAQDNRAPFGGVKQSGLGRNLGYEGVLEFMEPHSISGPAGWLL